jgi:uncharacterized protein (DUF433 family)
LPPLTRTETGGIRITGTRVSLDTVVAAFDAGASPEEMIQQYPTLTLSNAYAVIAYVLANRAWVDAYMADSERAAEVVLTDVEKRWPSAGLRDQLLARREVKG